MLDVLGFVNVMVLSGRFLILLSNLNHVITCLDLPSYYLFIFTTLDVSDDLGLDVMVIVVNFSYF